MLKYQDTVFICYLIFTIEQFNRGENVSYELNVTFVFMLMSLLRKTLDFLPNKFMTNMNFLVLAFLRYVVISCFHCLFAHAVTWPGCPHQAPEKMRNLHPCSAVILLAAKGGVS